MNFNNYWSRTRRTFYPTTITGCVFWAKSPEGQSYITVGTSSYITAIIDKSGLNNNINYNQVNGVALPFHTSSTYPLTGANASSNWRLYPKYSLNTQSIPNYFSASMTNSLAAPTGSTFIMIGQRIGDGNENRMHIDCQGSAQGLNGPTFVYPSHKLSLLSGGSKQNLFIESSFTYSSNSASITVISRSIPINKNAPLIIAYSYNQSTRDLNFWINGGNPIQFRITNSVNPLSNSFRHVMTTDTDFTELECIKYNRELSTSEINQIQNYAIEMYGIQDITTSVTKAWSPLNLPGLKAWFDANHVGYNSSNQVQSWYDLAGEGFDLVANDTLFKPEMELSNSLFTNSILFRDGRKLTSSLTITGSNTTDLVIAAVYSHIVTSSLAGVFSCGNLQSTFAWYSNTIRVNGSGVGTNAQYTFNQPSLNTKYYSIITISLANIQTQRPRHIRNGSDLTLTQTQNNTTNSVLSDQKYVLGGQSPGTNVNNMSGSIAELIFITQSISNNDITNLQNYFTNKYGAFV